MSITALVCHVALGAGSITLVPGIVDSPRYTDAEIRIQFDGKAVTDIVVTGPFDNARSYRDEGLSLLAIRSEGFWIVDATLVGQNPVRESLYIDDRGRLLWTQLSYADQVKAAGASVFTGSCEVAP